MKTRMLALLLLAGGSLFAETRFSVGIHIGNHAPPPVAYYGPPPPPPPVVYMPAMPAPGYVWVPGYWVPNGRRHAWREGRWMRPPHAKARWVAPKYKARRFYPGYWR
jgi:hypothetical protein